MKNIKKIVASIILGTSMVFMIGCGSQEQPIQEIQQETQSQYLTIEEGIQVDNSGRYEDKECKYNLEIESVQETNERNEYSQMKANRVIVLRYRYENIGNDPIDVLDWDFTVCGENKETLEQYDGIVPTSDTVNKGMTGKGKIAFAIGEKDSKVYVNHSSGITWQINIEEVK